MDRSNVLTLIAVSTTKDSMGQIIESETKRDVFCNVSSVTRSEWLTGGQAGFQPEYQVIASALDYQNEKIAELEGKRYFIYRTYLTTNDNIELYLDGKVGITYVNQSTT